MLHCDDDALALAAMGEAVDPVDEAHLEQCVLCHARLEEFVHVVSRARSITPEDGPTSPPPEVWAAIQRELGTTTATVTSISGARSSRRPRTWLVAAAAAVVGVIVGGVATAGLSSGPESQQVIASADLGPIDESGFTGTATLESGAGGASLTVSVPDLPPVEDGYYEVWMATPDTSTMVAIGTLSPGQRASFALPAGMDTAAFPVIDVSVEHFDGDAGHSATSVVRGQLPV